MHCKFIRSRTQSVLQIISVKNLFLFSLMCPSYLSAAEETWLRLFIYAFRFVLLSGLLMKYWILLTGAVVTFLLLIDPVWHFDRLSLPKVLQTPRALWCHRVPKWHRKHQCPKLTHARHVFTLVCCGCDGHMPARRVFFNHLHWAGRAESIKKWLAQCQVQKAILLEVGVLISERALPCI